MPSDIKKHIKILRRFLRAVEIAQQDVKSENLYYVSYDHSVCSPWLITDEKVNIHDRIGNRIFELYFQNFKYTPYRLVLSWATYQELRHLLVVRSERVETIARRNSATHLKNRLLSSTEAAESFIKIRKDLQSNAIDFGHLAKLVAGLHHKQILGTFDVPHQHLEELAAEKKTFDDMALVFGDARRLSQNPTDDEAFARDMDVVRALEILRIQSAIRDHDKNFIYTGQYEDAHILEQAHHLVEIPRSPKPGTGWMYSKDPLCILCCFFAFEQAESSSKFVEVQRWLNTFVDDINDMLMRLRKYNGTYTCLSDMESLDKRKLEALQQTFIRPIFGIANSDRNIYGKSDNRPVSEGNILDFAEIHNQRSKDAAQQLSKLLDDFSQDESYFNSNRDLLSDKSKKKLADIVRRLGL